MTSNNQRNKMDLSERLSFGESKREIEQKLSILRDNPVFVETLNSVNTVLMVLNSYRQVVFYNNSLMELLNLKHESDLLSLRPGEIFNCVHLEFDKAACGTTRSCQYCGILNTFLRSVESKDISVGEAVLSISGGRNIDIKVGSRPIEIDGIVFYVVTVEDISSDKRKRALERVFFHDIINTAGGLDGLLSVLEGDESPANVHKILPLARIMVTGLIDEIQSQRELINAESDDLFVMQESVKPYEVMNSARETLAFHPVASSRTIEINDLAPGIEIRTDKTLLKRVIINLLKNALEASNDNSMVVAEATPNGDRVIFSVRNEGYIPEEVQARLFKRSFSTKSADRGLGLYSVRLFTEKYLKGTVSFTSDKKEGTAFFVELPL